jgi:hypothetical protein
MTDKPKKVRIHGVEIKSVRIQEGHYTVEQLASILLQAAGGSTAAKKAITEADNKRRAAGTTDNMLFLAAYHMRVKHGCSDYTALTKLLSDKTGAGTHSGYIPEKHRRLWDKLKASGQTLEQITRPFRGIVTAIDKR